MRNIPGQGLGWPSATALSSAIAAASGSSRSPGKGRLSSLPSRLEESAPKSARILVIEDNKADVFLLQEALAASEIGAELLVIRDGEEAIRTIDAINYGPAEAIPNLFILDLNLPKRTGHEILARIRESPACASVPVLVVTSSDSEKDRREIVRLGCDNYFRKPSDFDEFLEIGPVIRKLLSGKGN